MLRMAECLCVAVCLSFLSLRHQPEAVFQLGNGCGCSLSFCGWRRRLNPFRWTQVLPLLLTMLAMVKVPSLHHTMFICVSPAFQRHCPCNCPFLSQHILQPGHIFLTRPAQIFSFLVILIFTYFCKFGGCIGTTVISHQYCWHCPISYLPSNWGAVQNSDILSDTNLVKQCTMSVLHVHLIT